MEANKAHLLKLLNKSQTQFHIPIYQRTYSWKEEQCKQLWSDVLRVVKNGNRNTHFIGSIVYIEEKNTTATTVDELMVIDGQQRLTSVSLLLAALGRAIELSNNGHGDLTKQKIANLYLFNPEEQGKYHHKLVPTEGDRDTYAALINDDYKMPASPSKRLLDNYRFFETSIATSNLTPEQIYTALGLLVIVDVSLERGRDNPQLIFESLNSTGLELTQADLIRNFLLMGLETEEQTTLYENFWFPMEQSFEDDYALVFDRFMRDYLTLRRSGNIPNIRDIYTVFKEQTQSLKMKGTTTRHVVEDIYQQARYFTRINYPEREIDNDIQSVLGDLKELRVEVASPLIMELYDDYEHGALAKSDFIKVLRAIESYVFRRAICGIPTNSLNKTFATLSRNLEKSLLPQQISKRLKTLPSYRRFPDDVEFMTQFVVKDVYNFPRQKYLLRKLENYYRSKEPVNIDNYSTEHIMPQNSHLSSSWQNSLGKNWETIQQQYLHTIGNLTLTGYNAEMSDRPFIEKRDNEKGFARSPLYLNQDLRQLEDWNEDTIRLRAKRLAELAVQIWPTP